MLSDIKFMVQSCQEYLKKTNTEGTPLEAYLTKYLLIHIGAEYEKEFRRIVQRRAINNGDHELASFVIKKIDVRSLRTRDLKANILDLFNERHSESFQKLLDKTPATSKYQNIITNRNLAAHGEPINMSFNELITTYESATEVLNIFSSILNS